MPRPPGSGVLAELEQVVPGLVVDPAVAGPARMGRPLLKPSNELLLKVFQSPWQLSSKRNISCPGMHRLGVEPNPQTSSTLDHISRDGAGARKGGVPEVCLTGRG